MSPPGRPKSEYRSAQREGAPASGVCLERPAAGGGDNRSQVRAHSPAQPRLLLV